MNLNEANAAFVTPRPVKTIMSESSGSGAPDHLRVRGIYGRCDIRNENNRVYPLAVWKKNLGEASDLPQRLGGRRVLGELEHPESGVTHLGRVSHLVEEVVLEHLLANNDFGVEEGDYVIGQHLVLHTPSGKVLRELYDLDIPVGVSSRGRGDVVADGEGVDVVQDNYEADTWDCVFQPSVVEATPTPVVEQSTADPLAEYRALMVEAKRIGPSASLASLVEVSCNAADIRQRLSARQDQYNTESGRVAARELYQLSRQTMALVERVEADVSSPRPTPRQPIVPARSSKVKKQDAKAALIGALTERCAQDEIKLCRLAERTPATPGRRPTPSKCRAPGQPATGEVSEKRYAALSKLADGLLKRGRALKTELSQTQARCEAATVLAEGLAERLRRTKVADVIEAAIQQVPALETSRALLQECKSPAEVTTKLKVIRASLSPGQPSEPAPVVESVKVPAGGEPVVTVRGPRNLSDALHERKGM